MLNSYERKHSNDGREERTGSRGKGKDLVRVEKERVWRKSMKRKSTKWMISDMERVWQEKQNKKDQFKMYRGNNEQYIGVMTMFV